MRMIPDFVDGAILPPGIHSCSWDELVTRFGRSERRRSLCNELRRIVDTAAGCAFLGILLWGSFPTAAENPGDLDLLFITLPGVSKNNVAPECAELLEPERSRERFGHDFLQCSNDPEVLEYLARYLGYDSSIDKQKGVLRLDLPCE